jgi:FdhD protein
VSERKAATARRPVERLEAGAEGLTRRVRRDELATEEPLEIRVAAAGECAARPVAVTMRTPGADFELAAGFLYGESLIENASDLHSIRYCVGAGRAQNYNVLSVQLAPGVEFDAERLARNFYTTSSCGVCGKASIEAVMGVGCSRVAAGGGVSARTLLSLPAKLREAQRIFERTGGLHGAALFTCEGELLRAREDVGRHNAMDKLVGASLLERELPWSEHVVMVSGRLSFELVQKAARAGATLLVGVSAPSSLAVELAEAVGMTLVGFLREDRMNVYVGGERVENDEEGIENCAVERVRHSRERGNPGSNGQNSEALNPSALP